VNHFCMKLSPVRGFRTNSILCRNVVRHLLDGILRGAGALQCPYERQSLGTGVNSGNGCQHKSA
jgi:hypothetical protein